MRPQALEVSMQTCCLAAGCQHALSSSKADADVWIDLQDALLLQLLLLLTTTKLGQGHA